jgi:hypothetical protein
VSDESGCVLLWSCGAQVRDSSGNLGPPGGDTGKQACESVHGEEFVCGRGGTIGRAGPQARDMAWGGAWVDRP